MTPRRRRRPSSRQQRIKISSNSKSDMDHGIYVSLFALGLFLGMLMLLEVGRRIGARRVAEDPTGAEAGVGTVDRAVFVLLWLLIAVTFSGAASRFDTRRPLIVAESY